MSTQETPESVSYGLILYNPQGQVLVVKRSFSYGFSSLFSMLLLRDTTASRPDQFLKICQELVQECTPEELEILRGHWAQGNFQKLLDLYLKGLPTDNLRTRIRKEFKVNSVQVKTMWELLLGGVKVPQKLSTDLSRTHDVPKGRHCDTLHRLKEQVKFETDLDLPDLDYGREHEVCYKSNTGVSYRMILISAKCSGIKIESKLAEWHDPKTVKMHPSLIKVIVEAISD